MSFKFNLRTNEQCGVCFLNKVTEFNDAWLYLVHSAHLNRTVGGIMRTLERVGFLPHKASYYCPLTIKHIY